MRKQIAPVVRLLPAFFWALLIFYLSSIPGTGFPKLPFFLRNLPVDKVVHFSLYFVLAIAMIRGHPGEKIRFILWAWISLGFCVVYGITDEVHQYFVPGRDTSIFDLLADTLGAGVASWVSIVRFQRNRERPGESFSRNRKSH